MLDELRDETLESAISKITAAVQTQQLEATDEEDEGKDSSLPGAKEELQCEKNGNAPSLGSLSGVNHGFGFHLRCSGRNATICSP